MSEKIQVPTVQEVLDLVNDVMVHMASGTYKATDESKAFIGALYKAALYMVANHDKSLPVGNDLRFHQPRGKKSGGEKSTPTSAAEILGL